MSPPGLAELTAYLSNAGWTLDDQDDRTVSWRPGAIGGPDIQVVLPVRDGVLDMPDRMTEALRAIAYAEHRLVREVLDDIAVGGADTVAVRLTPDLPPGEAPLGMAQIAVTALREWVVASASALDARSLVLPSRRSQRAEAFADNARFAAQPGSFVLALSLPLTDGFPEAQSRGELAGQQALLDAPAEPYGRRVTGRMLTAVRQAQQLATAVGEGARPLSAFGRQEVANATELAALSMLGGSDHDIYQIRFAFSPRAGTAMPPESLKITPAQQRILAEAAEFLRTRQPRPGVTVSGLVVRLFRQTNHGPGEIVVHGIDDDTDVFRKVRVELAAEDYARALRAHGRGEQVRASGDLDIRGTRRYLRNLTTFSVLESLDDE
ncbi:hypothetical protein [Actinocorallia longicatena]|uniref:Uncharacterized protein n=1 Tax=Actinocorallia longicatena TaxID=111803 RepID=A0ABP6QS75_9ACTN